MEESDLHELQVSMPSPRLYRFYLDLNSIVLASRRRAGVADESALSASDELRASYRKRSASELDALPPQQQQEQQQQQQESVPLPETGASCITM